VPTNFTVCGFPIALSLISISLVFLPLLAGVNVTPSSHFVPERSGDEQLLVKIANPMFGGVGAKMSTGSEFLPFLPFLFAIVTSFGPVVWPVFTVPKSSFLGVIVRVSGTIVAVAVGVAVAVAVAVGVAVAVCVGVAVDVAVEVGVEVAVGVAVAVGVSVAVAVAVAVGVAVAV